MSATKTPSWEEIRRLIDRVDEVCRESELARAQAERTMRRRDFWPDRRHSPRHHDQPSEPEDDGSSRGGGGIL